MTTATPTTPSAKPAVDAVTQATQQFSSATQACCKGANDAFKAYGEANQKLFSAFTKAWGFEAFNPFANTMTTNPTAAMATNFDAAVKAMNGIVDANARFVTECNSLMIDAIRTNVRTLERTGALVASQMSQATGTTPNAKAAKPVTDIAREIFDEASTLMTKTSERLLAMNTEHVQHLTKVMEETFARASASKPCCNG